jgi:hypothetical protein
MCYTRNIRNDASRHRTRVSIYYRIYKHESQSKTIRRLKIQNFSIKEQNTKRADFYHIPTSLHENKRNSYLMP